MPRTLSLIVRNVVFTIVVPGLGGIWFPWWILTRHGHATPAAWEAVPVIVAGAALYLWCAWNFATVGGGTPGLWDAPRQVVATGPYRRVRNPIYIGALLVVLGEAWLFMSVPLLDYAGAMAVFFHLFVTCYEEPMLGRRFGSSYLAYRRAVPRWFPRWRVLPLVAERGQDLQRVGQRVGQRHRRAALAPLIADLPQRPAAHVLHHYVRGGLAAPVAGVPGEVVGPGDARVLEPGEELPLGDGGLHRVRVTGT
jgi:protein-S-isoprenylcysteine O-methyltransferase Ste14